MTVREEAEEILNQMHSCRPKSFFGKMDDSRRGMNFVLCYLKEANHEVLAGELARELNVSTARIAALLKTMEKNGLIERYHPTSDARHTIVKITQEGTRQAEQLREHILKNIELLLEKVGREKLEEFIRLSNEIREALGE